MSTLDTQSVTVIGMGPKAAGFCGACLLVKQGRPVAVFNVIKEPNRLSRYSYLILFKADPRDVSKTIHLAGREQSSNNRQHTDFTVSTTQDKKTEIYKGLAFDYLVETDTDTSLVTRETFKALGKPASLEKTRVFLMDLTRDAPRLEPVEVQLPAAPDLITARPELDETMALIEKSIEQLRKESKDVDRFFGKD